jgi:outer membrane protein TolC
VAAARARQHSVSLEYLPRLELLGALWVRGSGYFPNGNSAPPGNGLVPDTPNWAAGVALTWPVLETVAIRARTQAEAANVKINSARLEDLAQLIDAQLLGASAVLDAARRIAAETPVAVSAARAAETQATARYRSGLASVLEVAEAERLLTEAEIQDAEARLGVWSALLLVSRAAGDIGPFLAEAESGVR